MLFKKREKTPKRKELIVKLSTDDIMRILVTHFQKGDFGESFGHGELLGTPGEDLRFIGYFRTDVENAPFDYDINEIDKIYDFTGD